MLLTNVYTPLTLITDGRNFKKATVIRVIVRYKGVRYKEQGVYKI